MAYSISNKVIVSVIDAWVDDLTPAAFAAKRAYARKSDITEDNLRDYAVALIYLEAAKSKLHPGGIITSQRFEPHVYARMLRDAELGTISYGKLPSKVYAGLAEATVKAMATSWGLFQIMGYYWYLFSKNIIGYEKYHVHEFIAANTDPNRAFTVAFDWLFKVGYPSELTAGNWGQCFHMHNTGRKFKIVDGKPQYLTHHADYVPTGVAVMEASAKLAPIVIKQKKLKEAGLYGGPVDGIWGNKSQSAWDQFVKDHPTIV